MNARKFKGQKILAMAVVAMFAFCAFSVCFTDNESDATPYAKEFNVNVIEGASFSYTPAFNTSTGEIALTHTGTVLTQSDNTGTAAAPSITFTKEFGASDVTPEVAGGNVISDTIKATWTPYTNAPADMKQTASQTINFHVYERVKIDPNGTVTDKSLSKQFGNDATIVEIPIKGPVNMTITAEPSVAGYIVATVDDTNPNQKVTIKTASDLSTKTIGSEVTITVTINASDNDNSSVNKDSKSYTFTIFPDLTISCVTPEKNTYIGKDGWATQTFDFNLSDETDLVADSIDWDGSITNIAGAKGVTADGMGTMVDSTGIYTIDISSLTNNSFAANNDVITFSISSSVKYLRNGASDTNKEQVTGGTATLKVYKAFEFTQVPELTDGKVYSASGNPLDILMSADFEGTTKITYNWGDGKSTTVNTNPDSGSKYSARHVYANEGVYVITVTAYNSSGTTTAYTLYDAKNAFFEDITGDTNGGEDTNPDTPNTPTEESFFDKHGYQFIIFAVIAILAFVAFFFFGIQNPVVLIAGIITALLAVLCFVYNDIGGLIEELKALLKL